MSFIGPLLSKLLLFRNSTYNLRGYEIKHNEYNRRSLLRAEGDLDYMTKQEERAELYYISQQEERYVTRMQGDYLHINANFPCIPGGI